MYSEVISERFQNLQNAGVVTNAEAVGQVDSVDGGMIKIYLRVVNGVITEAKFKTNGGVYTFVASDFLCDMLKNRTIDDALLIKNDDIVKAMPGLPENKMYVADLAQTVVANAVEDYYKKLAKAKLNEKK